MKVLAYFLYGNDPEIQQELEFSVLSALRFLKDQNEIVIRLICDHDRIDLPIEQLVFSAKEFVNWTRNYTYCHRAKIGALLKALDYYQCPVILLDTDTFFTDHPAKLFDRFSPTRSLMHQYEWSLRAAREPGWQLILEKMQRRTINGIAITPDSPMYNSGVIGVDPVNRSLLETSFEFLDPLYDISPVFNVDQFAVGMALGQKTQISECADVVQHYWGAQKDFIRAQIAKALKQGKAETLLTRIPPFQNIYPKVHHRDRIVTSLSFFKHRNNNYRRAQLAYHSALSYAVKDIDYANAWASNALQALKISNHPAQPRDFQRFRQESIQSLNWLSPRVKRSWIAFWQQMT